MEIERGGKTAATVKKALVSPLRDRYSIEVDGGTTWRSRATSSTTSSSSNATVTRLRRFKPWFRVRDSYGIEIAPGQDDALILAAAICIDQMARG